MNKSQSRKLYMAAKKQLTGKKARVMSKYNGTIKEIFEHYTTGFVALITCNDGREIIATPNEIEIEMERKVILGYTISSNEILNAA